MAKRGRRCSAEVTELLEALLRFQSHASASTRKARLAEREEVLGWLRSLSSDARQRTLCLCDPPLVRVLASMVVARRRHSDVRRTERTCEKDPCHLPRTCHSSGPDVKFTLLPELIPDLPEAKSAGPGIRPRRSAKTLSMRCRTGSGGPNLGTYRGRLKCTTDELSLQGGESREPFVCVVEGRKTTAWGDVLRIRDREVCRMACEELESGVCISHDGTFAFLSEDILSDLDHFESLMTSASLGGFLSELVPYSAAREPLGEAPWMGRLGDYSIGTYLANRLELVLWKAWWEDRSQKPGRQKRNEAATSTISFFMGRGALCEFWRKRRDEKTDYLDARPIVAKALSETVSTIQSRSQLQGLGALPDEGLARLRKLAGFVAWCYQGPFASGSRDVFEPSYGSAVTSGTGLMEGLVLFSSCMPLRDQHDHLQRIFRGRLYALLEETRACIVQDELLRSIEEPSGRVGPSPGRGPKRKKKKRTSAAVVRGSKTPTRSCSVVGDELETGGSPAISGKASSGLSREVAGWPSQGPENPAAPIVKSEKEPGHDRPDAVRLYVSGILQELLPIVEERAHSSRRLALTGLVHFCFPN
jgi:hypothetical protein